MKAVKLLACCLLVLPLVGTAPPPVPKDRAKPLKPAEETNTRRSHLLAQLQEGINLFRSERYAEAAQWFEAARRAAVEAGIHDLAARAVGDIGSTQFALHQYQPALRSFLEAQKLARAANDPSAAAIFGANIASLYAEMGALDAATQSMQGTLEQLSPADRRQTMPKFLIQMATFRARQDRMDEAVRMFAEGIDGAEQAGSEELAAIGWNRLGEEYLKRGDLKAAEPALLEAYRLRKLHHLPLDSSYRNLGRLRLEQGELDTAAALLDRAVELSQSSRGPIPSWDAYHYRGRVRMAQGRLADAVADLRVSLRLARAWRWSIPADDASRVGAEGWLEQVHSAMVEAGNRLYRRTGDRALIRETFEAAEENRASSLRTLLSGRTNGAGSELPPEYWKAIGQLQRAEVESLRSPNSAAQESLDAIRAQLVAMEAAGDAASVPFPTKLLARAQGALDADSALLSFQLGKSISWMWALDRQGLELYVLPPRQQIELQVSSAARALRDDIAGAGMISANLYQTLFGELGLRFRAKSRWLLALDRGMFDAPVAALTDSEGAQPRPTYVAEHHVIEFIPGVGYWVEARARRQIETASKTDATLWVGIGDPVYNTADPRLLGYRKPTPWSSLFATAQAGNGLMLPRLVASGSELDTCARVWTGEHTLLKGRDASRLRVQQQLARNPAVLHFATHVVESHERPLSGMIALSLTARQELELLSPVEIAHWRTHAGLVVLSGCHSAAGEALPGTGLMGLTRAWLLAGAGSVVSSDWDTADESGALFRALYARLGTQGGDAARALRDAQLEMIAGGGWRSLPRYWGAFSLVGNL